MKEHPQHANEHKVALKQKPGKHDTTIGEGYIVLNEICIEATLETLKRMMTLLSPMLDNAGIVKDQKQAVKKVFEIEEQLMKLVKADDSFNGFPPKHHKGDEAYLLMGTDEVIQEVVNKTMKALAPLRDKLSEARKEIVVYTALTMEEQLENLLTRYQQVPKETPGRQTKVSGDEHILIDLEEAEKTVVSKIIQIIQPWLGEIAKRQSEKATEAPSMQEDLEKMMLERINAQHLRVSSKISKIQSLFK